MNIRTIAHLLKLPHYVESESNLKYATEGSWCFDICTSIPSPITIKAGERHTFPTGIKLAFPSPIWWRICSRSGLAVKHGIITIAGLIDNDYRGEPLVCLLNTGKEDYTVHPGDKIAQVELPFPYRTEFKEVSEEEFNKLETSRSSGGFGSTGR